MLNEKLILYNRVLNTFAYLSLLMAIEHSIQCTCVRVQWLNICTCITTCDD